MLVLKVCIGAWENESRDKRELAVCEELGCATAVLAKGNPGDKGREDGVAGYKVYRYTTRPLGGKIPNAINRLVSIFVWARYIRKHIRPDIISGHDLPGLLIGWISNWFRKNKSKLVYDSHEFEVYRNCRRSEFARTCVKWAEHFLIKKTAFAIMVNDSIADEVQKMYKLYERPVVVRSIPYQWNIDLDICAQNKEILRRETHSEFVVMYHGAVMPGRGIEALLYTISKLKNVGLIILGNPITPEYLSKLERIVEEKKIANRIAFRPAIPVEHLWKYVGAADISMANISPIVKSYYYALPNKFFESIQSLTPIIASDLPEMKKIIEEYGIGLVCKPDDVNDIGRCITLLRNDELYSRCKRNLIIAKEQLSWEQEKIKLIEAYQGIIE